MDLGCVRCGSTHLGTFLLNVDLARFSPGRYALDAWVESPTTPFLFSATRERDPDVIAAHAQFSTLRASVWFRLAAAAGPSLLPAQPGSPAVTSPCAAVWRWQQQHSVSVLSTPRHGQILLSTVRVRAQPSLVAHLRDLWLCVLLGSALLGSAARGSAARPVSCAPVGTGVTFFGLPTGRHDLTAWLQSAESDVQPCPGSDVTLGIEVVPNHRHNEADAHVAPAAAFSFRSLQQPVWPTVVTAANERYVQNQRLPNLIGSIHTWEPTLPIVVYDLGLAPSTRAIVSKWRNVVVRGVPWLSRCPVWQPRRRWLRRASPPPKRSRPPTSAAVTNSQYMPSMRSRREPGVSGLVTPSSLTASGSCC